MPLTTRKTPMDTSDSEYFINNTERMAKKKNVFKEINYEKVTFDYLMGEELKNFIYRG